LILAVYKELNDVVDGLLKRADIDVNAANERKNTALIVAASRGHRAIVDKLRKVPDIDFAATDKDGATAMKRAMQAGHPMIATILMLSAAGRNAPIAFAIEE